MRAADARLCKMRWGGGRHRAPPGPGARLRAPATRERVRRVRAGRRELARGSLSSRGAARCVRQLYLRDRPRLHPRACVRARPDAHAPHGSEAIECEGGSSVEDIKTVLCERTGLKGAELSYNGRVLEVRVGAWVRTGCV